MKNAKVVIIAVCISAAGFLYWFNRDGEASIPDTPDSLTAWMCNSCQNVFSLTAAEAMAEEARAGGPSPLFCRACSKKEAYRVAQCDVCSTYFFSSDVPNSLGRCPACFPPEPRDRPDNAADDPAEEPPPPAV